MFLHGFRSEPLLFNHIVYSSVSKKRLNKFDSFIYILCIEYRLESDKLWIKKSHLNKYI